MVEAAGIEPYLALDVETANPNFSSICQIGVVTFEDGRPTSVWETLINPEDYFDPWHYKIHGINEHDVFDAPTIVDIFPQLETLTGDQIIVHHTAFDRVAISRTRSLMDGVTGLVHICPGHSGRFWGYQYRSSSSRQYPRPPVSCPKSQDCMLMPMILHQHPPFLPADQRIHIRI